MPISKKQIEFEPTINILRDQVGVTKEFYFNQLPKDLRALSFYVADLEKMRQIESVRSSLENALDKGLSFREWQETFDQDVFEKLTEARQELVFRNNLNNSYNQATRYEAFENIEATPYLLYSAILDERVRASHEELDGIIRPADDDFWDYNTPPLGHNCRCTVIPIDADTAKELRENAGYKTPQTTVSEINSIKSKVGVRSNAKSFGDSGFTSKQKIGNFSGVTKKKFESAIEDLPNNSPYKSKFKEAFNNVDRKVEIWWQKINNKFRG